MIDLSTMEQSQAVVKVEPSNRIFEELGKNTYDYKDLLSEFIDNSIAARRKGELLSVVIDIYADVNGRPREFVIKDNAKGIAVDKFGSAIAPAGVQSMDSLNEHGLGLKQAVAALGKLKYLATKTENDDKGRLIQEFKFGDIPTFYVEFDSDAGTEIAVTDVNPILTAHAATYTRTIVPYLGARYRRFLKPHSKQLDLTINLRSFEHPEQIQNDWVVTEVKPIYFHPSTRNNEPVILGHRIEGDGWAAELTFGYAPTKKEEYEEMGLEELGKFHPYKVTLNNQGLDIVFQDRVILFHQLYQLGIISARHPDYNNIRGEIDLKYGFSTAITKNSIIGDAPFVQCIDKIKKILNGEEAGPGGRIKNYITRKTYPEEIPERLLRDRLGEWLSSNPIKKRIDIKKEYPVGGIEGFIDILADGEAWELKTDQASAYDVYQLFMYMDVDEIKKGFLVAKGFTTGAQTATEHIKTKHGKEIVLATRDQFPINQPPTDAERADYY